jgi:hypothetical protein
VITDFALSTISSVSGAFFSSRHQPSSAASRRHASKRPSGEMTAPRPLRGAAGFIL